MIHFFAKFGRRPVAKYILPGISTVLTVGYYSFHSVLHDQIRDLLAAQTPTNGREEVSESLRKIVTDTYIEVQADFMKPVLQLPFDNFKSPPPIKWFASSTLEPITLGMTDSKTGVLIGLPNYYNYEKADDLPANLFEIRQLRFFRSPQDRDLELDELNKAKELVGYVSDRDETVPVKTIDRYSEEGKDYIDSMLLSEEAKKFSIARELFMGDSYRPLTKSAAIFISFVMAMQTAKLSVIYLRVGEAHLTRRLPGYLLSGIFGYGTYLFFNRVLDDYYAKESDKRAKSLGEAYERGAAEYYSKRTRRRLILGIN